MPLPVVTIMTDFGLRDGFVGVMKGVILSLTPQAQIADISHEIAPQDVLEGAYILMRCVRYFPPGTVHIAVVDPGVGTARRPVAGRVGTQFFVGPDNGLFSYLIEAAQAQGTAMEWVHLDRPEYWREEISNVFHGRDIFAPVGAYLAGGMPLTALGTPISDLLRLTLPRPEQIPGGWRGRVMAFDQYGNIFTNLERQQLGNQVGGVLLCGAEINGLVNTFGERPPGELIALYDEADYLMVSVVNGDARQRLQCQTGDIVEVYDRSAS